ncbi:MAG: hypothetical protein BWZ02_02116 [Lentisphaerae bacterium ADurb.BinA184]|nr:MAG: hypothetical protein BWZ02_02116 [Lentisphaerae bacterium ADurb.BinA184]
MDAFDTLPDGTPFPFWDDRTAYRQVYHVAQGHPRAADDNPGTEAAPFASIGRAAQLLQPGEKVVVHAGVYRECVRPARGGTATDGMIAYEAAPGEPVVVTGAEAWTPAARPSAGWAMTPPANGATVWMADLPEALFRAYNPFLVRNAYEYMTHYAQLQDPAWLTRAMMRRGMIFCNGRRLAQVFRARELSGRDGAFWVEESGLRVHFRLPGDAAPETPLEVSAREQTFAPSETGLGYIRVSGFTFTHAAGPLPVPQRGSLSTSRGHHWIIEDCRVEWANGVGIDIGIQSWDSAAGGESGHHIVRRNRVSHCGICGLAGALGVTHTLVEDNVFEHIGWHNLERMYECGGIKFHLARHCLLRRNVFRHLEHAGGVWLDVDNINCRIAGNVFADLATVVGAIYSEMNYERNRVDHNLMWDVRRPAGESADFIESGSGLRADCNDTLVADHNVFGRLDSFAILFSLIQSDRRSSGRTGLCRANSARHNLLVHTPRRLHLGRREENASDWNLFDSRDDNCSFHIAHPAPGNYQKLASWQQYFGLDEHSAQARITAAFDPDTLVFTWRIEGELPAGFPPPGPLDLEQWSKSLGAGEGRQVFPVKAAGTAAGAGR